MDFAASTTLVEQSTVRELVEAGVVTEWTHPRTGKTRYYFNYPSLRQLIGLEMDWYRSGNVRGCSYVDAAGDRVNVAHSRAFSVRFHKCFIEGGTVFCDWRPYGENIAELVAMRATE